MVKDTLNKLASHDPFWTESCDCCGELSISPHVEFLAAQKMICYGVSFSAFKDYFQMGESTAWFCMRKLVRGIVECSAISEVNLHTPTKSDAFKIAALQKKVHDLSGCLGSLDVTKIHRGQCQTGCKGQFQGKESELWQYAQAIDQTGHGAYWRVS